MYVTVGFLAPGLASSQEQLEGKNLMEINYFYTTQNSFMFFQNL